MKLVDALLVERRKATDAEWLGTRVKDEDNNLGVVVRDHEGKHWHKLYVKFDDPNMEMKRILLSKTSHPTHDAMVWSWQDNNGNWWNFFNPKDKEKS